MFHHSARFALPQAATIASVLAAVAAFNQSPLQLPWMLGATPTAALRFRNTTPALTDEQRRRRRRASRRSRAVNRRRVG